MDLLEIFSDSKNTRRLAHGEVLFEEGDPGDAMYVVIGGQLSVESQSQRVDSVPAGGIIGEMAMIDNRPRSATAVAATDCEVVPIDPIWFKHLVSKNPDFAIHVMSVMADRVRRLVALSTGSAGDRVDS